MTWALECIVLYYAASKSIIKVFGKILNYSFGFLWKIPKDFMHCWTQALNDWVGLLFGR